MPMESVLAKSEGDEHGTAGEPMRTASGSLNEPCRTPFAGCLERASMERPKGRMPVGSVRRHGAGNPEPASPTGRHFASAASMAATSAASSGETRVLNRPATLPSLPIRNFSKFQPMSPAGSAVSVSTW
jgi:hypothetical protein